MAAPLDNQAFRNLLLSWPEKAMVQLYQYHYDSFIRLADMYTHDRNISEDVLQDVFTDVWQKRQLLGQPSDQSIHTYLIKAIEYHSISLYKKNAKTVRQHKQYYYSNSGSLFEDPVETTIILDEKESFVRLILATFPQRERECFLMQVYQGMAVVEIGRRLGISKKAVERNLTSARKRLKRFRTG